MSKDPHTSKQTAIQKRDPDSQEIDIYEGQPRDIAAPEEPSRWKRFLGVVFPWFVKKKDLGERYLEVQVRKEEQHVSKDAAETAEIAVRTEIAEVEAIRQYFDLVDAQIAPGSPEAAHYLKLAKILEKNPHIAEQLSRIREISDVLKEKHGTEWEIVAQDANVSTPQIPPPEERGSGSHL